MSFWFILVLTIAKIDNFNFFFFFFVCENLYPPKAPESMRKTIKVSYSGNFPTAPPSGGGWINNPMVVQVLIVVSGQLCA